ncbi:MAG: RNA polymerase subunit sigma-24, partial [Candidatus Binatia bacterium]
VLLEDQDRSLWNRAQIAEGLALAAAAVGARAPGRYALQAAIAAEHGRASRPEATDWRTIADLYGVLLRLNRSPVIELNRAVAVAMADGPEAGLALVADLRRRGELGEYHLLWAVEADLLRRLRRFDDAAGSYRRALALATTTPERRFLERRLAEMERRSS